MKENIEKLYNKMTEFEKQLFDALMELDKHMDNCDCDDTCGYHDFSNILEDGEHSTFCLTCGGMVNISNEDCL